MRAPRIVEGERATESGSRCFFDDPKHRRAEGLPSQAASIGRAMAIDVPPPAPSTATIDVGLPCSDHNFIELHSVGNARGWRKSGILAANAWDIRGRHAHDP